MQQKRFRVYYEQQVLKDDRMLMLVTSDKPNKPCIRFDVFAEDPREAEIVLMNYLQESTRRPRP